MPELVKVSAHGVDLELGVPADPEATVTQIVDFLDEQGAMDWTHDGRTVHAVPRQDGAVLRDDLARAVRAIFGFPEVSDG